MFKKKICSDVLNVNKFIIVLKSVKKKIGNSTKLNVSLPKKKLKIEEYDIKE